MNIVPLIQSLQPRYDIANTDFSLHPKRETLLSECIVPSATFAIAGQGAVLQTQNGSLIDLAAMTVNCILGQNDPWVNANIISYLLSGRPSFLTTRIGSEYYYKVAARILEVTKMRNAVIDHRQCNGTDVTELAVLAAYAHRQKGQTTLVSFTKSYHGQGLTAFLMSGLQRHHRFLLKDAPILFLEHPTHTDSIDSNVPLPSRDIRILEQLEKVGSRVFAVILEPIQVNNVVNMPSRNFLKALQTICKRLGITLIFDEVQTGFGWLGTMTASERYGVWPDMLAVSKALTAGNGPLAALITEKKYQDIKDGTGAKTNGADIRSLIAADAVMERLLGIPESQIPSSVPSWLHTELKLGLLSMVPRKSHMLTTYLKDLQRVMKGLVGNVKGEMLIRGIEICDPKGVPDPLLTKKIQADLLEHGVLVRHVGHTLLFKPPVVITEEQMSDAFAIVTKILKKYRNQ